MSPLINYLIDEVNKLLKEYNKLDPKIIYLEECSISKNYLITPTQRKRNNDGLIGQDLLVTIISKHYQIIKEQEKLISFQNEIISNLKINVSL